ncbi:MAG: hypothetical protein ACRC67_06800 [Inquilinus sp.]|uniref:hypothetical protein n=1 Tax=Inquilinus sp. TaxID=1932117 RepID=UPI003F3C6C05
MITIIIRSGNIIGVEHPIGAEATEGFEGDPRRRRAAMHLAQHGPHGRTVAEYSAGPQNIGQAIVRSGWA